MKQQDQEMKGKNVEKLTQRLKKKKKAAGTVRRRRLTAYWRRSVSVVA